MHNLSAQFNMSEGAQVVEVTPEMAQHLIDNANFGNRKLRPSLVSKYAKLMRNGDWKLSPETIAISKTGRLLNGQHRMHAVVQSGGTHRFLFATGFDDDVFGVLDRGAKRSISDAIGVDKKLAQAATVLVTLSQGNVRGEVTDSEVSRAAAIIRDTHDDLMNTCGTMGKVFSSAPFRLAAAARVMGGDSPEYVFGLYRNLNLMQTEVMPPIGHAAVRAVVQNRLISGGGGVQRVNASVAWDLFDAQSAAKSKIQINLVEARLKDIVEATGYGKA